VRRNQITKECTQTPNRIHKREFTFRMRASFKIVLVRAWAMKKVMGNTTNHVTTKLYGSGNCNVPTPADLSAL